MLLAAGRGSSRCGGLAAVLGADTWTGSGAPRLCGPGPACPLRPGFRPTHYTERTWSGGMAPPARPQDRAAAPPSSQQLPSSPSPLLNLTPDQPLLVESLPIWVHSCKAPPAPLEFPALHFRSRPPAQITARRVEGAPRTHFLRFDTESNLPERNRLDSQGISLVIDSTRPSRVSENPPGPECWISGLC